VSAKTSSDTDCDAELTKPGTTSFGIWAQACEQGGELVVDASPEAIGQTRQNFPQLKFVLQNGADLRCENEFDAVFSNAALHWMLDAGRVAAGITRALRPGRRLAAEFSGKGNIAQISGGGTTAELG
jgi:trans-aconitate methyltransferase